MTKPIRAEMEESFKKIDQKDDMKEQHEAKLAAIKKRAEIEAALNGLKECWVSRGGKLILDPYLPWDFVGDFGETIRAVLNDAMEKADG